MSVSVQLRASDIDCLQIAKFLVKQGKTTREAIKEFASASRYKAKVNGQIVSYNYTDVYFIIIGLQASTSAPQPVIEESAAPEIS